MDIRDKQKIENSAITFRLLFLGAQSVDGQQQQCSHQNPDSGSGRFHGDPSPFRVN